MTTEIVAVILETVLLAWLAALGLAVAYQLLSGKIERRGLLVNAATPGAAAGIDPERLQLLIVFLVALAAYVGEALARVADAAAAIETLPPPPRFLVEVFLASNALYLSGKLARVLTKGKPS